MGRPAFPKMSPLPTPPAHVTAAPQTGSRPQWSWLVGPGASV